MDVIEVSIEIEEVSIHEKNYEIIDNIITLKDEKSSDTMQINYLKWFKKAPVFDIRKWDKDGKPLKGFTLTEEQLREFGNAISDYFYVKDYAVKMEEEPEPHIIDFRKFVIRNGVGRCLYEEHDYEEVKAYVYVYSKTGKVNQIGIDAYHCMDCNAYYITENTYRRLKISGTILCQVFTEESFELYKNSVTYGELKPESILHQAGYNVGQDDNLTDKERQTILQYVIESGLMEKDKVIYHLAFMIKLNEGKKTHRTAVKKWQMDKDYLSGYKPGQKRLIGVSYIVK